MLKCEGWAMKDDEGVIDCWRGVVRRVNLQSKLKLDNIVGRSY